MQRVYLKYEDDTIVAGQQPMLKILGVSKPTFTKWVKEGLPFEMRGKTKVYKLDQVQKWVNQNVDYLAELELIKTQAQIKEIEIRTAHRKLKLKIDKKEYVSMEVLDRSQGALVDYLRNADEISVKRCTDPVIKKRLDEHYRKKWDGVHKEFKAMLEKQDKELEEELEKI